MNTWALAIFPSTGDVLAGTFDNGIFRRGSKKTEWIATSSGLTNTGVSQVVSLRSPGYRVMRGGVLWSRSPTGWSIRGTLAEKICMGFVVHVTSDPRRLYSDGCGSLKSEDGGATWMRLLPSMLGKRTVLAVDPQSPQRIYAAEDESVAVTEDGGSSWRHVGTPGLRPQSLLVDGKRHSRLWIRSATELRRSDDGGKTWRSLDLPATGAIEAFSPASGTESALIAVADAGLFRTVDGGTSWTHVLEGRVLAVAIDPGADRHLLVALAEHFARSPVRRSASLQTAASPGAKSSSRELRVWQLFG